MRRTEQTKRRASRHRIILAMATWLAALTAASADAQEEARLEVGAGQIVDERGEQATGATVSASVLSVRGPSWSKVGVEGALPSTGGWVGAVGGAFGATGSASGLGLGIGGSASVLYSAAGHLGMSAELAPSARMAGLTWRVETGPTFAVTGMRNNAAAPAAGPGGLPLGNFAPDSPMVVRPAGGLRVVSAGRSGAIGWGARWSITGMEDARWTDVAGRLAYEAAAVSVALTGGRRQSADRDEMWAGGRVAIRFGKTVELLADAGRAPSDPLTGRWGGTHVGLGVALRTGNID